MLRGSLYSLFSMYAWKFSKAKIKKDNPLLAFKWLSELFVVLFS